MIDKTAEINEYLLEVAPHLEAGKNIVTYSIRDDNVELGWLKYDTINKWWCVVRDGENPRIAKNNMGTWQEAVDCLVATVGALSAGGKG